MKKPLGYIHDFYALESDTLLTAIMYQRIDASTAKWKAHEARTAYLKKLILDK